MLNNKGLNGCMHVFVCMCMSECVGMRVRVCERVGLFVRFQHKGGRANNIFQYQNRLITRIFYISNSYQINQEMSQIY